MSRPDATLAALDRLSAAHPALEPGARILRALIPLVRQVAVIADACVEATPAEVLAQHAAPLAQRVGELAHAAGTQQPLERLARAHPGQVAEWALALLAGDSDRVASEAQAAGLDPAPAISTLRIAVLAQLEPRSRHRPSIATKMGRPADCPACGTPALLAESRGLEARRHLRCGLCGASWERSRTACPACGEDRPDALVLQTLGDDPRQPQLLDCRVCGLRLPIVPTLERLDAAGLLVAELAVLPLLLAAEAGDTPSA
jgi:FdhE protein